jgi:hypothetical protein
MQQSTDYFMDEAEDFGLCFFIKRVEPLPLDKP